MNPIEGYLGYLQLGVIMNKAAMKFCVEVFFCEHKFSLDAFGHIQGSMARGHKFSLGINA